MGPEIARLDAVSSAGHPRAPPQLLGPPCPRKNSLCPTSLLLGKPLLLCKGMAEQPPGQGQLRAGVGPLAAAGGAGTAPACCLRSQSPLTQAPWRRFTGSKNLKQNLYTGVEMDRPMLSSSRFQTGNHTDIPAGTLPTS